MTEQERRDAINSLCDKVSRRWEELPDLSADADDPDAVLKALDWDWQRAETAELLRKLEDRDPTCELSGEVLGYAGAAMRQHLESYPELRAHAPTLTWLFKAECVLASLAPRDAATDA
jgi:hypothetical protein